MVCDPEKDLPLCGTVNCEGELTLYKTNKGQFYTLIIELNECEDAVGREIELNTNAEAAQIMWEMGFKPETIKQETGYEIIGERLFHAKKKNRNHSNHLSS